MNIPTKKMIPRSKRIYSIPKNLGNLSKKRVFAKLNINDSFPTHFISIHICSGGLNACITTGKSELEEYFVVVLQNTENITDSSDETFFPIRHRWDIDLDRVIAIVQNSIVTWNSKWDNFHFTDPNMLLNLRDKLGLPPLDHP
jgi:hypothetical protein